MGVQFEKSFYLSAVIKEGHCGSDLYIQCKEFFTQLSKDCYDEKVKQHFKEKKPEDAINMIKQKACEDENSQKLLNLLAF